LAVARRTRGGGAPLALTAASPVADGAPPGEPAGEGIAIMPGSGRLQQHHAATATPPLPF